MWEKFEFALSSARLDKLVEEMKNDGLSQVEIYDCFYEFYTMLKEAQREDDEDKVLDVLDRIVGWCSPHNKLFPHYLSNEEIDMYRKLKGNNQTL
jgi:hypothetical protein